MVTGQPAAGRRVSIRNSLRLRFPLLIAVLSVEVFAVFLWLAFREVEASHIRAGGQRAQSAADQITGLFERPAQQGLDQLRALASDDTVKRLLQDPNDQTREAARQRFEGLKAASPG